MADENAAHVLERGELGRPFERRPVFELDHAQGFVSLPQVVGKMGEAPLAGARCRTEAPLSLGRENHAAGDGIGGFERGDTRHQQPVGAAVEQRLDCRAEMVGQSDQGGHVEILKLTDAGLTGNTHIPFADMNNDEVAKLLFAWLDENDF